MIYSDVNASTFSTFFQICCFVEDDSFSGAETKNPYHFSNFGLNSFTFKINGENHPTSPFKPDFENGKYTREVCYEF